MEHRLTLNGTWNWCEAKGRKIWEGQIPGSVLTDMTAAGMIQLLIKMSSSKSKI